MVLDYSTLESILAKIRTVKYGDYVLAEDHNYQTDAIKELKKLLQQLEQITVPNWRLIKDIEVETDTQNVDLTELDILTHKAYRLVLNLYNPTTEPSIYHMYINGDYDALHYYVQLVYWDDTTMTSARGNSADIAEGGPQEDLFIVIDIGLVKNQYARAISYVSSHIPSSLQLQFYSWASNFKVTNITSIRVAHFTTTGIGAGSRIQLYGYK